MSYHEKQKQLAFEKLQKVVTSKGGKIISTKYIDSKTNLTFECVRKHQWDTRPSSITSGHWCGKCPIKSQIEARESFELIVKQKGGTIMGAYINCYTKVAMKCPIDHPMEITPSSVKNGQWCQICSDKKCIQAENEMREIVTLQGGTVIGDYINNHTKFLIKCMNDHPFETNFRCIKKYGIICKTCNTESFKVSFEQMVLQKKGIVIGIFSTASTKIEVMCESGHIFKIIPYECIKGAWCKDCPSKISKKVEEQIIKMVEDRGGKVLEPYLGLNVRLWFECEYQHSWKTKPYNIRQGKWCSICKESKLEREAKLFLDEQNITYIREYKIPELPNKKFDFYFEYNDDHILIELDGSQHFEYTKFYHKNMETYVYRENIDRLKTLVAFVFGYKLIRIDYKQLGNLSEHIIKGISTLGRIYYSSLDMYEYLNDEIPADIIINHSRELAIKYNLIPQDSCHNCLIEHQL